MAQFGRPSADTANPGVWIEDGVGDNAVLFDEIDESAADNVDFIQSPAAPVAAVYVTKLSALVDPAVDTGHVVRYRYGKNVAAGQVVTITVELRQDYVSDPATLGTLIHSETHADVPVGFTDGTFTLTIPEAALITDYANLFLRFNTTAV